MTSMKLEAKARLVAAPSNLDKIKSRLINSFESKGFKVFVEDEEDDTVDSLEVTLKGAFLNKDVTFVVHLKGSKVGFTGVSDVFFNKPFSELVEKKAPTPTVDLEDISLPNKAFNKWHEESKAFKSNMIELVAAYQIFVRDFTFALQKSFS